MKQKRLSGYSDDSHYRKYPLGMNILSFAEDDKLRPGEDVTSSTGMTKFR